MFVIGIYQVIGSADLDVINLAALQEITGIGHIGITIALVWMLYRIYKFEKVANMN